MKAITHTLLVLVFSIGFVGCSSGGGGGGKGKKDLGGFSPVPTGKPITEASSELAKSVADTTWCDETAYEYDDNGIMLKSKSIFKSDGSFAGQEFEVASGNQTENFTGTWGANETHITVSAKGQTLTQKVELVEENGQTIMLMTNKDDGEEFTDRNVECN